MGEVAVWGKEYWGRKQYTHTYPSRSLDSESATHPETSTCPFSLPPLLSPTSSFPFSVSLSLPLFVYLPGPMSMDLSLTLGPRLLYSLSLGQTYVSESMSVSVQSLVSGCLCLSSIFHSALWILLSFLSPVSESVSLCLHSTAHCLSLLTLYLQSAQTGSAILVPLCWSWLEFTGPSSPCPCFCLPLSLPPSAALWLLG